MGERLRGELQWQAERRTAGPGALLYLEGSAGVDSAVQQTYNRIRPHSSLGYKPSAPEAELPPETVPVLAGLTWRVVQRLGTGQ